MTPFLKLLTRSFFYALFLLSVPFVLTLAHLWGYIEKVVTWAFGPSEVGHYDGG